MHNERCTSGSEGGLEKPIGRKADRALRSDPTLNPMKTLSKYVRQGSAMTHIRSRTVAVSLAVAMLLASCCGPVRADGAPPGAVPGDAASDAARTLVDEVLRKAGGGEDGLGDWTRGVIGRALDRAGKAASNTAEGAPAPLPAERHAAGTAAGLAGRPNTSEIIVFTSLAVPAASWRQWAREAARIGAPLVLRGVGEGGLRATVKRIGDWIGDAEVGIAIDPRLFRLFGIARVPAVVVAPGGVPACVSRGCSDDPAPAHDLVAGNIGLAAALEVIAAEGGPGRDIARRHLGRLRGETE